ncbi:MAG: response regulator [Oscillospiraceae bacterium]|jgi:two-component system response regulator YesN|nr:response regulator [Oscillospiraceae bacterium]
MVKLLIADDEPLVCVGLQSMLKWRDFGIEIVGTARNGAQAMEMIERFRPDIVISDIKMPIKTGLELAEECAAKYGRLPLFIFLTNYEEFAFVKQALFFQAVDYLVKIELSPEMLSEAIQKALAIAEEHNSRANLISSAQRSGIQSLREKFFLRLYNNLFESDEQYLAQKEELMINFSAPAYIAASGIVESADVSQGGQMSLFASAVQMLRETLSKIFTCYVTILDLQYFSVVFCLDETDPAKQKKLLERELSRACGILRGYFGVSIRAACGSAAENPRRLDESFQQAQHTLHQTTPEKPILFYTSGQGEDFDFSKMRPGLRRAFEEMDTAAFHATLTEIIEYFSAHPDCETQALDTACNVLYMATSLLPDGENTVRQIFEGETENYRGIHRLHSAKAVVGWLEKLRDGCCDILAVQKQGYRKQVVNAVQEYIRENLGERLTLNNVAAIFNFSPNYLSQLFSKYAEEGFVEYITSARIKAAKEMLSKGNDKIFEISEKLGFESAYYFSKVFKKLEGVSPRTYIRNLEKN